MDAELRSQLELILHAGEIPVADETLCVLVTGKTPDGLDAETFADQFRRHLGVRGGLDAIEVFYNARREVFDERFPSKAQITALKKHISAIEQQLEQEWFCRHLVKFSYLQQDAIESLRHALEVIQRVEEAPPKRREPETYLFASLYDLFLRLGGPKSGFGDPFYSFAKLATQLIAPDLLFPSRAVFKDRLKKHRKYAGVMTPWQDSLQRKLTDDLFASPQEIVDAAPS
jgi:hypothetical protein